MKFTLYYRGRLPSNGSTDAKDCIRRAISPQLCDLWNQGPLKHERENFLNPNYKLTAVREVAGKSFSCIVNAKNFLVASLDIMFLRPEEPGLLVTQGGDIDNRMKTLLDALAIPKENQIKARGDENGGVVHCLLEDDNLITGLNISVDRLLDSSEPNEVLIVIGVNVSYTRAIMTNLAFSA